MILSKTPYRIPLSGGGTDISFYYKKHNAHLISFAIDQYVFVLFSVRSIEDDYFIQTTYTQFAKNIKQIDHSLIRETLKFYNIKEKIHVGTYSTLPTGTGVGSSSAMVVGLINCINQYKKFKLSNENIIKDAYKIERIICKQYGGWQDQIISQHGGILDIKITKREKVNIKNIKISNKLKNTIKNNLLIIYTKQKRNSSQIINSQRKNRNLIKYYNLIKSFNKPILDALKKGNIKKIGEIFNAHWILKKNLSNKITNKKIDKFYTNLISRYKIIGGKLIGAGGGGFILACCKNKKKLCKQLDDNKIGYINLNLNRFGSKIINI